jgi:ABC-2 type transport system ATP-binding protein
VIGLAQKYGFIPRCYGNDLAFLLPEPLDLKEVMTRFEGIPIDPISRQPVRLEYIYLEITQDQERR